VPRDPDAAVPAGDPNVRALRTLDLGDANGLACDIDDPDCVMPAAPAVPAARIGGEGDA